MLKRFLSYYKPHKKLFLLDLAAALLASCAGLIYPSVARTIINDYAPNRKLDALVFASLFLLLLYGFKAVCNYIIGYYGHVFGVRVQADMRRDLFAKFQRLPFSYFDKNKTGDLLSRLVGDLFDVAELAHHAPENLLLASLMLVGAFFILWSISSLLTRIMAALR